MGTVWCNAMPSAMYLDALDLMILGYDVVWCCSILVLEACKGCVV